MRKFLHVTTIAITFILLTVNCKKEEPIVPAQKNEGPRLNDSVYWFVNGVMNYWYLWNEEIPEVDYLSYDSPTELLDDLTSPQDKWSFVDEKKAVEGIFKYGEYFGFGFYMSWDEKGHLQVAISYKNSDAYKNGIKRGCKITHINDIHVQSVTQGTFDNFFNDKSLSMTFKFIDPTGKSQSISLQKKTIQMNGVIHKEIITQDEKKIAYLVYDSFLEYTKQDLTEALTDFNNIGIDELIVDLRYNGGGHIYVSEFLADVIVDPSKVDEVFYELTHNKAVGDMYDTTHTFKSNSLNLGLKRVFFIVSDHSASASELIINGLKPHMEVITIGKTTHGKPVGMYGFTFQDWIVYPVTTQTVNADGYGDYFDGIIPDMHVQEKMGMPWADITDPWFSSALYYIKNGEFDYSIILNKSAGKPVMLSEFPKEKRILIFGN